MKPYGVKRVKAQSEILSLILITFMFLGFLGFFTLHYFPRLEENRAKVIFRSLENFFDPELPTSFSYKVKKIALRGGEEIFEVPASGLWKLFKINCNADSYSCIQFTTYFSVANVSLLKFKEIEKYDCRELFGNCEFSKLLSLCKRMEKHGIGYNVSYTLCFGREELNGRIKVELKSKYGIKASESRKIKVSSGLEWGVENKVKELTIEFLD